MDVASIVDGIDEEIARLGNVEELLTEEGAPAPKKRGRRPGAKSKRTLSPEARVKIAAAQKRRWAKAKRG